MGPFLSIQRAGRVGSGSQEEQMLLISEFTVFSLLPPPPADRQNYLSY